MTGILFEKTWVDRVLLQTNMDADMQTLKRRKNTNTNDLERSEHILMGEILHFTLW